MSPTILGFCAVYIANIAQALLNQISRFFSDFVWPVRDPCVVVSGNGGNVPTNKYEQKCALCLVAMNIKGGYTKEAGVYQSHHHVQKHIKAKNM